MKSMRKAFHFVISFLLSLLCFFSCAQKRVNRIVDVSEAHAGKGTILYGTASYYANKFNGRKTANGQRYNPKKLSAACNVLPLNTWIKVTNLRNHKSVILKINDRLSKGNKFLVDLSKSAAKRLGFFSHGLTKVKVQQLTSRG